jgi:HSP20 family molecular chaperone IbpA
MSQITITKIQETGSEVLTDLQALDSRIRERAFEIFQKRDSGDGGQLDDWLEAERDLTVRLETDLVENDSAFQLNLAAPGFKAKDLSVTALPDAVVVRGESRATHREKILLSRFELPVAIDVDQVTASLDNGVLRITAAKATAGETISNKREAGSEKGAISQAAAA